MADYKFDLYGKTYGLWKVISYDFGGNWHCVCQCENKTKRSVAGFDLRNGKSKCCGCIATGKPLQYHGYSQHRLYKIHTDIEYRCNDPSDDSYHNYGGRGIYICDEWSGRDGRIAFIKWSLENGWEKGLEIDRIDNDGPYAPWNCRYVTRKENDRNRRGNIYYEFQGKERTAGEILELHNPHNLSVASVVHRLKKGQSVEEAINTPKLRNRKSQKAGE